MSASGRLLSLVYTSTASHPFRETALEQLLEECRRLNAERDVTGMLLHRSGRFIQVLEGEPEIVRALAERIRNDGRHHDMRVLIEESIDERRFPDWTMGYRAFRGDPGLAPAGYRDSFADLYADADRMTTMRALSELTLWFRVRTARSA
ncbi:BLUF domain-containing protein [Microbacterium maritypicum]